MKLPKNFGGMNLGNMLKQAQEAQARLQALEQQLEEDRLEVEKGPVKATFSGTGCLVGIRIDPSLMTPDEVDVLEDLIVSIARDGFAKANEARSERVRSIVPDLPGI